MSTRKVHENYGGRCGDDDQGEDEHGGQLLSLVDEHLLSQHIHP